MKKWSKNQLCTQFFSTRIRRLDRVFGNRCYDLVLGKTFFYQFILNVKTILGSGRFSHEDVYSILLFAWRAKAGARNTALHPKVIYVLKTIRRGFWVFFFLVAVFYDFEMIYETQFTFGFRSSGRVTRACFLRAL